MFSGSRCGMDAERQLTDRRVLTCQSSKRKRRFGAAIWFGDVLRILKNLRPIPSETRNDGRQCRCSPTVSDDHRNTPKEICVYLRASAVIKSPIDRSGTPWCKPGRLSSLTNPLRVFAPLRLCVETDSIKTQRRKDAKTQSIKPTHARRRTSSPTAEP